MFFDTTFLKNDEIQLCLEKTVNGDEEKGWVPAYHFAICNLEGTKMGTCDLRVGHNDKLYFGGNIGYRVEEPYRGHHYAGKACEYVGGELLEIVELPEDNDMRERGMPEKCIYRFEL